MSRPTLQVEGVGLALDEVVPAIVERVLVRLTPEELLVRVVAEELLDVELEDRP